MDKLIKNLVVKWLFEQLSNVDSTVSWPAVKGAVRAKVEVAVPGRFWDAPAMLVADQVIDGIAEACHDEAVMKSLIQDCVAGNWDKAMTDLEAVLAMISDPSPHHKVALEALRA